MNPLPASPDAPRDTGDPSTLVDRVALGSLVASLLGAAGMVLTRLLALA